MFRLLRARLISVTANEESWYQSMNDEPAFQFEFDNTRRDFSEWRAGARRTRWSVFSLFVKGLLTIVFVAFAIQSFLSGDNTAGVAALVVAVFVHHPLIRLALEIMFYLHPKVRVTIDDSKVTHEMMRQSNSMHWTMLAHTGTAEEHPTFFSLKLLLQMVLIPKRAFKSDEQMQCFREFVQSKMGERCRFGA